LWAADGLVAFDTAASGFAHFAYLVNFPLAFAVAGGRSYAASSG
jgi:hypothetical protein